MLLSHLLHIPAIQKQQLQPLTAGCVNSPLHNMTRQLLVAAGFSRLLPDNGKTEFCMILRD